MARQSILNNARYFHTVASFSNLEQFIAPRSIDMSNPSSKSNNH